MQRYTVSPDLYDQSIPQVQTAKLIIDDYFQINPLKGEKRIIDACCGTGQLASYLATLLPEGEIIGLDKADNMISFANKNYSSKNVTFQLNDLTVFDQTFKHSADLIICSWGVSHIPAEQQSLFTKNLRRYLKPEGKLVVFFPVMGSMLSKVIQAVVKFDKWQSFFANFENKRMTFTADGYKNQLTQAEFINQEVQTRQMQILFNDDNQLKCFITTAVARYLPWLQKIEQEDFIHDIAVLYKQKVPKMDAGIPYEITMLLAVAQKKPMLTLIAKNLGSPIHVEVVNHSVDEQSSNEIKHTF